MLNNMADNRLEALNRASQKKKQSAEFRTKEALNELTNSGEKITIRSVARKAGVSVSYIYKYPELTYKIQRAKEEQKYSSSPGDRQASDTTPRIEQLQQENVRLIKKIEGLKTRTKENKTGSSDWKKLQQENIQLTAENQQLQRELDYTRQKLQEAREFILKHRGIDQRALEVKAETKVIRQSAEE